MGASREDLIIWWCYLAQNEKCSRQHLWWK